MSKPTASEKFRDFIEALRMPRHDDDQRIRGKRQALQRIEKQYLFAFTCAAGHPDLSRAAEKRPQRPTLFDRARRDFDIELHVAGDANVFRA